MPFTPRVTVVTCYHFGKGEEQAYERLIHSLKMSIQEIGANGHIVLVANGTGDREAAVDPEIVRTDLAEAGEDIQRIISMALPRNLINTGGLNAGIEVALNLEADWIFSIQSSATLRPGWLNAATPIALDPQVGAIYGRILRWNEVGIVHNDGHTLNEGLTLDVNFEKPESTQPRFPGDFPCLSAAMYRHALVQQIWNRYGDFVSPNLAHYGDCGDVALRAKTVAPEVLFKYCRGCIAFKRKPKRCLCNEFSSQLLAAQRYYCNRRTCAEKRIEKKSIHWLDVAKPIAAGLSSKAYARNIVSCPSGTLLDKTW
jgi:hypothetical protein